MEKSMNLQTPFYQPLGNELEIFGACLQQKLPVLLVGPTGCGKTRFVQALAAKYDRKLIQVACNEDTSGADLVGRFLLKGAETVWQDGPITRAVREGAILYLDEIAEAREDVTVLIHPLADFRRELFVDRTNECISAHPNFLLVASFNPGYQASFKELKPSTRQRFVTIPFHFPEPDLEATIVMQETGCARDLSQKLAKIALRIRQAKELDLRESVSTRLLINAAHLHLSGISPREAAFHAIAAVLSDDLATVLALKNLIDLIL
jgi:nitric oxide reductase NorQ protein